MKQERLVRLLRNLTEACNIDIEFAKVELTSRHVRAVRASGQYNTSGNVCTSAVLKPHHALKRFGCEGSKYFLF